MQGRCFSYQPQWQPFPLLEVRADVVVTGLDVRLALLKTARVVVKDVTDLLADGHFLQAIILQVRIWHACWIQPVQAQSSSCHQRTSDSQDHVPLVLGCLLYNGLQLQPNSACP